MARQAIFRGEEPPYFWAVLDESVLHRRVGGPEVMERQLERLLKDSASPNVTIQILPFTAGTQAAMSGDFTLWSYPDRSDVLYVEGLAVTALKESVADVESARPTYDLLQAAASSGEQIGGDDPQCSGGLYLMANLTSAAWRKSSYSTGQGGECIEVADGLDIIPVRDSKDPHGPALTFAPAAWTAFIDDVKAGRYPGA